MAIYHASVKPIARKNGRSAVAAAAYRAKARLKNERDGKVHDYTRRQGVEHAEIVLPERADAGWALDRSELWNEAERVEKRADARVAREVVVALPAELDLSQRVALCRDYSQQLADRYGVAVDFACHEASMKGDNRNFHAHLMITTRQVTRNGLAEKSMIERENKWLLERGHPTSSMQVRELRKLWAEVSNLHLARAGHEVRIDHRSFLDQGIELAPTFHKGVDATNMERERDREGVYRSRLYGIASEHNRGLLEGRPDEILKVVTSEKSVFDRHDVARAVHRYVDEPDVFSRVLDGVMSSPELIEVAPATDRELAKYSTREIIEREREMMERAERLSKSEGFGVRERTVDRALGHAHVELARQHDAGVHLSVEQEEAVRHVTAPERLAVVVGLAGAGKSTMLSAARRAWEAGGSRVRGGALAGKAAEGLQQAAGIESRTLASWQYSWKNGFEQLQRGDVFVLDEAGMVGSRQLAEFLKEVDRAGAKLVLVGDHQQLQAIGAGAPFRAIAEQAGFAELSEVRRQQEEWQRRASVDLARHRTHAGIEAYANRDRIAFRDTRTDAVADMAKAYVDDVKANPISRRLALAHRRVAVRELNVSIRSLMQEQGLVAGRAQDVLVNTTLGKRQFAQGDRLVFLENNRELGVKNGTLGAVISTKNDELKVRLDDRDPDGRSRVVTVGSEYRAFDHGYATTIHKTQGATVDRVFVLASRTMDRHLAYVAMTRHRQDARLFVGRDEFENMNSLVRTLSRSREKENALDYANDFAVRRGLAEKFGIESDIVVPGTSGKTGRSASPASAGTSARQATVADDVTAAKLAWDLRSGVERAKQAYWDRLEREQKYGTQRTRDEIPHTPSKPEKPRAEQDRPVDKDRPTEDRKFIVLTPPRSKDDKDRGR